MKVYSLNEKFMRLVHSPKDIRANSKLILKKTANMNPHTGVNQEIKENIDLHDTMTPIDILKVINVTTLDKLLDSRDTNHEAQADTETSHAIVMIAHVHQVISASKTDAHDGITNIHVLNRPYETCLVLDVAAHSIHLPTENVLHHLNK